MRRTVMTSLLFVGLIAGWTLVLSTQVETTRPIWKKRVLRWWLSKLSALLNFLMTSQNVQWSYMDGTDHLWRKLPNESPEAHLLLEIHLPFSEPTFKDNF